jgi:large subunit ribosomal protein L4
MAAPKAKLIGGKSAKDVSLEAEIFGAEVKPHLLHETVRAELNARRAGTRGAKTRGLVSGGRAKPWRQKGTGRARIGSIRAPHWTGGGVAFGPTPRDYTVKINRKARRRALRAALSVHAERGSAWIVDAASFESPSTKTAAQLLDRLEGRRVLVLVGDEESACALSFRNIERVSVLPARQAGVADVIGATHLVVSEAAIEQLAGVAGGP